MAKKNKQLTSTNEALWRMFRLIDQAYFDNRLRGSVVDVRFAPYSFMPDGMGRTHPIWSQDGKTKFKIYINSRYRGQRRVIYNTLLHECLHADKWWIKDCDGVIFDREMRRLCERGAMRGSW